MSTQQQRTMRALNILTKWRVLFTGWQLGTRPKGDPEGDAVRDHRELTILLRAEVTAFTALLREKGVFTDDEWLAALERATYCAHCRLHRPVGEHGEFHWVDPAHPERQSPSTDPKVGT